MLCISDNLWYSVSVTAGMSETWSEDTNSFENNFIRITYRKEYSYTHAVVEDGQVVGHLPWSISTFCSNFIDLKELSHVRVGNYVTTLLAYNKELAKVKHLFSLLCLA